MTKYAKCGVCEYVIAIYDDTDASDYVCPVDGSVLVVATEAEHEHVLFRQSATFIVAASNSVHKERADYLCPGVDDQVVIQAAIDALPAGGGKVVLQEGLFIKSSLAGITIPSNVEIRLNAGAIIKFKSDVGDGAIMFYNSDISDGNENISIVGSGALDGSGIASGKQTAIKFTKVSKSLIDTTIKNFKGKLIDEEDCKGIYFRNRQTPNIQPFRETTADKIAAYPKTLIDSIDTGWEIASVGSLVWDTEDVMVGEKSLKITSPDDNKIADVEKTFSTPIDLENKVVGFWIKADSTLRSVYVFMYSTNGGYTNQAFDVHDFFSNNNWFFFTLSTKLPWRETNNPDMSSINKIKFIFYEDAEAPYHEYNVRIDGLYYVENILTQGLISFTFDDGYSNLFTEAKPIFDKYAAKGVGFVLPAPLSAYLGTGEITLTQMKKLQEAGWDICNHTYFHHHLINRTEAEYSQSIHLGKEWLISNGFGRGARFLAAPAYAISEEGLKVSEKCQLGLRALQHLKEGVTPLPLPHPFIYSTHVLTEEGGLFVLSDYTEAMDKAKDSLSWLVLTLHSVTQPAGTGSWITSEHLDELVSYAISIGLKIVTFSDVYDNYVCKTITKGVFSDLFMDVLAVSATHIRANEDISAATPITFTIDAQPDVPRTLSGHFDSHVNITEYDIEIIGVDAKGNTITETKDETDGWDWETGNAFATITSIKMTSRTGTGIGDTMDIGITDVLGLSNIIYEASDVFKIKKNNANATVAAAQVNTTYDTYDMAVIGLAATDDFTIWFKSNLNIIS